MGRKQASLSLRVSLEPNPPAVILLQEPGKKPVKIKDYATIEGDQYVATLVHKTYAATRLDLDGCEVSCCHIVIIPVKKGDRGVHVVNVYGNPKHHKTDYRRLIAKVVKEAGKDPVVIAGDFNAPHPGWGYKYVSPKGRRLAESINQERLTLLTEVDQPTRTGTSSCRDTCPDLTLVKNVANAEWTNLMEQLGSDHCILETTIHESGYTRKTGKARITDWDRWRKQRGKGAASIENIEDWSSEVIASVKPFVAEVELSEKTPAVDTRLLHLWEARRGLTRRWKKQRYNKKLRKRIQALTKLAEDYAVDLARKNWYGLCDSIRRSLGTAQAWRMLRALIDPSRAKAVTGGRLAELIHKLPGDCKQIMDQLAERYLCLESTGEIVEYEGQENPELDRPITVAELEYELGVMRKGAAPGPDSLTAKLLYNLGEGDLKELAFIIARLTYGTPYLNLNKAEMQKLNVLIRRAYKNALGLPERTATEKLLKLGVHNTIEELHEAQLVSQLKRLSSTVNGAWLLDKLGMAVPGGSHGPGDAGEELPAETRQKFTISRIPRNMHPDRNAERRQARAVALARSWDSREGTLYVDGAGPMLGVAAIAVASAQGQIRRIASIRAQTVEQVEEAAIALAVVCNPRATIISDSQRACQNFARGVVGQPALRLLRKTAVEGVHLIWTPGHMGQVGNEAANAAARGALYRDSVLPQRDLDSALTYSEALKALRTHRAEYPGPAKGLSKEEEFTWRRLQTDTFVTPIQLHLWYPERYATADCPFCGEPWVDVYHVVWACKNLPGLAPVEEPKLEEWEAGLKCATASEQRLLVARALRVHSALGAPE
ncbi:hypothetical protein HPB47_028206 [Ixodes persulcatus]|uniref:Uncharacterized protein n=1 Tax=Ixodes persulcatus TaxID=34615 RepID=A0AC60PUE4_IXOPE|nr:hypothetical protein HPB47_028206 [Ixodes persulcatus]